MTAKQNKELRESHAALLEALQDFVIVAVGRIKSKEPCWAKAYATIAKATSIAKKLK